MAFDMSRRQRELAASLGDNGPRVSLDPPESNQAVLSDEQVATTCARVFVWVVTGREPDAGAADDGWFAAAQNLRAMFAGEADPPPITTDQLIDIVRGAVSRGNRIAPPCPIQMLQPLEYAAWRAATRHGYNCVNADRDGMRENPLAERERVMVQGAREALGLAPRQAPPPPEPAPQPEPEAAAVPPPPVPPTSFVFTVDSFS